MKRFLREFKTFAVRGNVIDLAVGVIIGAAFGKITTSLVNDVVMPLLGLLLGGVDFKSLSVTLPSFFPNREPAVLAYGNFIGVVVDFLLIALVIFLLLKGINRLTALKKAEEAPPPPPPVPEESEEVRLLREIRDLLAK